MHTLLITLGTALAVLGLGLAVVNWRWPAEPKTAAPDSRLTAMAKRLAARFDRKTWIAVGVACLLYTSDAADE